MNKFDDSKQAKNEFATNKKIEMLNDEETKEYETIYAKANSKDELIDKLRWAGYSEFMTGVIIGHLLTLEGQKATRKWIPSILRK